MALDAWLASNLRCPRDGQALDRSSSDLVCPRGHSYPIADGVPVMLLEEVEQTHVVAIQSLRQARGPRCCGQPPAPDGIDPFVQRSIGATNGIMYNRLIGRLVEYPIPDLPLPKSDGGLLLDIGCNWGRWCIAASRLGYRAVGIEPSLEAVRAAVRIARQLGVGALYVVGDARYLPFADQVFDSVFSYSVLQHFAKCHARAALREAGRVLKPGGAMLVQMPNALGPRCLYHQVRHHFRKPGGFEVRYWRLAELSLTMSRLIGRPALSVDGFFALNHQASDARLLPARYRLVIRLSAFLKRLSAKAPWLANFADSIYVRVVSA